MELLKQGQYRPLSRAELTVALSIIDHGLDLPTADLSRFEEELLAHLRDHQPAFMAKIEQTRDLSDATKAELDAAIAEFKGRFRPSEA